MPKSTSYMTYSHLRPNRRRLMQGAGGLAVASSIAPFLTRPAFSQDSIELDFWNWWGVAREPLMNEIVAGFEQDYPEITVNSIVQPWDRRDEQVLTALAGGDAPEVLMATRQEIVQFADAGTIAPITQYVEQAGVDLDAYYESEIGSMWWNDELYSLPMPTAGGETNLSFYNKDLFERAGLDPESAPQTWDALSEAASALNVMADNGSIEVMGVDIGVSGTSFLAWLYCNNGTLYSDDLKSVAFNSEQGIETLQWMMDFVAEHYGDVQNHADFFANTTGESGEDPLLQGRLGLTYRNVSEFFHIQSLAPDLNYGAGLRAYNGDNPDAESRGIAGLTFGWGYVIPSDKDEAVKEAAYKWVQRLTYDEVGACKFVFEQARPSPIKACNENPEYQDVNPYWDVVQESLSKDVAVGVVPPQARILDTIEENVELAMFGEVGAEEALEQAGSAAQSLLDDYWNSVS